MKISGIFFTVPLLGLLVNPVVAGEQRGSTLFEFYGCTSCHGADGNGSNSVTQLVPKIGGKPADELFTKAKNVLSEGRAKKESAIKHAALYSSSLCDSPPTDDELKHITTWLSLKN